MQNFRTIGVFAFSALLFAGVASAQSFESGEYVTVTTSAATTTPTAGSNQVVLGNIDVQATQSGDAGTVHITSVPITVTAHDDASPAHLTRCAIYDASGTSVTGNALVNPSGSSQSFTFDSPVMLAGGSSQTWTVRCDVSNATPAGGSFTFTVGAPVLASTLGTTIAVSPTARPGQDDAVLAVFTLSSARSQHGIRVSSVPISFAFSNGLTNSMLTGCHVRPASDLSQSASNQIGAIMNGVNTFVFTNQSVPAGQTFTLALTCDVSASAPIGGRATLSITPGDVEARIDGSDDRITPVQGFVPNTLTLGALSGTVQISTSSTPAPTPTPTPTTPGVPNTGLGTGWDMLILLMSGLVVLGGSVMLMRRAY